jgi:hypothetical protein
VQAEALQKRCGIQHHLFLLAVVCVIFVAKPYFTLLNTFYAVVADGYLPEASSGQVESVPPQVFYHLLWANPPL